MLHIGRNILSLMISRVLTAVILFLIYTRLIQYLGPEVAGQYGLIAGYLTVFGFFVDLGMQQLVIKKVSEDRTRSGQFLRNYFGVQFFLGLGFMLIMDAIVWLNHYPGLVQRALYLTSVSLLATSLTMPLMAIINAYQRLSLIAKVNFTNSLINGAMMALAVIFRRSLVFLALIPLIVAVFDIFLYGYLVDKNFTKFRISFDFKFWKQLLIWNTPFMLLTLFSIYNRIDTLILPHLRSFVENGYYTAVYKFWDTLAFVPAVVAASLYPYFAESLARGERQQAGEVLETYTRYMLALGVPLSIGAFALALPLTVSFFGPAFAPAAPALWLLVAAVSVLFVYVPVNSIIISQKTKAATIITGTTLAINLICNFTFIPRYGFVAAAVITLGSELIQLAGYTIVVKRRIVDFPYWRSFIKPIAAGAIMAAGLYFTAGLNLWFNIAAGGLIYAAALLAFGFFRPQDWLLFKAAVDFRQKIEPPSEGPLI